MSTQTKWTGRPAFNHRVGWVVIWNDDYKSAMPDEQTAKQCALAPEMAEAFKRVVYLLALDSDNHKKANAEFQTHEVAEAKREAKAILAKLEGGDK